MNSGGCGFGALVLVGALRSLPVSLDHDEIRCRIGFAASLLKDGADIVEKNGLRQADGSG